MRYGSLFAGIGGFDLGFDRAGMTGAWQSEIQPNCQDVLNRHWPEVELYGDIQEIKGSELSTADIICGGFPCQDVSVAGRREGLAGDRSGLWFEFHRILEEHRPDWAIIENVPGLLSSNSGADFAVILRGLEQLGYGTAWRILDAQNFGVPQRRRRLFVVGHLGDFSAVEILFEPDSLPRDFAQSEKARQRHSPTIGSNSAGGRRSTDLDQSGPLIAVEDENERDAYIYQWASGGGDDEKDTAQSLRANAEHSYQIVVGAVSSKWHKGSGGPAGDEAYNLIASPLRSRSDRNSNIAGRGGEDDENIVPMRLIENHGQDSRLKEVDVSPTLNEKMGTGGNNVPLVAPAVYRKSHGAQSVEDHEIWQADDLSPTIDATGRGPRQATAIVENMGVRRLTPMECERLQGFPDGWTEGHSDTQRYRMIGNAVAVPVVEWIGRRIVQSETGGSDELSHQERN